MFLKKALITELALIQPFTQTKGNKRAGWDVWSILVFWKNYLTSCVFKEACWGCAFNYSTFYSMAIWHYIPISACLLPHTVPRQGRTASGYLAQKIVCVEIVQIGLGLGPFRCCSSSLSSVFVCQSLGQWNMHCKTHWVCRSTWV